MACVSALTQIFFLVMLSVIQGAYKEHIIWMRVGQPLVRLKETQLTQRSAISVGTKGIFQIKQARKDIPGGAQQVLRSSCLVAFCSFCNPMNCSPPGSSVHGISRARTLEWVAISFCKGSS